MKTFFGSLIGSFLGVIVAAVIATLIVAGLIAGAFSDFTKAKKQEPVAAGGVVLQLHFDKKIPERTSRNLFENVSLGSFNTEVPLGLNDILTELTRAREDSRVKGIYLELSSIPSGIATVEEIRNAILDFKRSGKFVLSYGETYSQGAYYLASAADKVYLNPAGAIEWKGLSAKVMFYRGLLDKLEINAQIFRHGKFKSAVEPFDLTRMSPASREQTMAYVGSIWNHLVEGISATRHIPVAELNAMADKLMMQSAADAKQEKMADELLYQDQVFAELNKRTGKEETAKINFMSLEAYHKTPKLFHISDPLSRNKIAIVYAVGQIESGEGDDNTIGSERISKAIREARLDSGIKAIVLRVNSPGGSALASDVIWREVVLARKAKPLVVSMGDVAASGGYYISCGADRIFAEPNTITGSIGVFGLLPDLQKMLNNKLGITIDTVNTNKHADLGSPYRPVTEKERNYILHGIEHVYADFISKVGAGRKMDTAAVDAIGQGRVWSGVDALKKGLVDELGGINQAVAAAAKLAKVEKYRLISLPRQKDMFSSLFSDLAGDEQNRALASTFGEGYQQYLKLKALMQSRGILARMPYDVVFY